MAGLMSINYYEFHKDAISGTSRLSHTVTKLKFSLLYLSFHHIFVGASPEQLYYSLTKRIPNLPKSSAKDDAAATRVLF